MAKILSIGLVILGVVILIVYAIVFFGKHGVLTGKDDEDK